MKVEALDLLVKLPSCNLLHSYIENGPVEIVFAIEHVHRNIGFSHSKWRFSTPIVHHYQRESSKPTFCSLSCSKARSTTGGVGSRLPGRRSEPRSTDPRRAARHGSRSGGKGVGGLVEMGSEVVDPISMISLAFSGT